MDHIDHPPLYPYFFRGDQDLFVLPVLRPQPHLRALAVEPLDGYLIPIPEQRDDHRAVRRNLVFFHHQEIPILYPGPHHALSHNPQQITPPSGTHREEFRSQRVGLVTESHRLEATTGGDPAEQNHVARRLPALLRQPERPRTPPHSLHVSFFLQPAKVVVYGLRTTQSNSSPDLTHTRRRTLHTRPLRKVAQYLYLPRMCPAISSPSTARNQREGSKFSFSVSLTNRSKGLRGRPHRSLNASSTAS